MLRDYQTKATEAARERAESGESEPPIELPPGFGKSDGPKYVQGIGRGERPDPDGWILTAE